jgi:hypothetical protein
MEMAINFLTNFRLCFELEIDLGNVAGQFVTVVEVEVDVDVVGGLGADIVAIVNDLLETTFNRKVFVNFLSFFKEGWRRSSEEAAGRGISMMRSFWKFGNFHLFSITKVGN